MNIRKNVRWVLAYLLFLPITLLMSLDRTAMTVAAPVIQKEMGFSLQQMSWILSAFHWAYAILSVPAGFFAMYFGARVALLIANVAWSILTVAIPFMGSASSLIGIRFCLGGFQAVDMPSSIASFRLWFPRVEWSRANSVLLAGLYLGPILGAPLTAAIVADFGWRTAFLAFGIAGVISAATWWTCFRNTPEDHAWVGEDERSRIREGRSLTISKPEKGAIRDLIKHRSFWTIGIQGLCTGGIMGFFNTWLPTYLMQERGIALKSLGFFSSLPWMILLLVVVVAAVVADRIFRRTRSAWRARVPAAMAGFLGAGLFMLLSAYTAQTIPALVLLAASLGCMGLVQVSTWPTLQDIGAENTGVLTAWNGMLTNAGSAIGPVVMASIVESQKGWTPALVTIAAIGIVGAVSWAMIYPRDRQSVSQAIPET
jgi:ACS family glucarate transporter-like MFS transporter